ncbi:hypothetical protein TSUD_30630 [Trifolium subterraneum]|uniref:Reverse transcriptase domain-containing protein n=1 Tax=Trifolium subterraneum TaxID=3900 RepID=A0A2Z6MXB7_TRISU|nr:hypothetical protein TSUD_30630 [Trifolium subterraneum]
MGVRQMSFGFKENFVKNSVAISHLQFADDTLLVGVKSWANVRALRAVLILFERISGLKVNFHKSLPIGGNPRRIQFWLPLIEKIRKRLSGWKCKNLSIGGRLILLKSVLSSIPGGCEENKKISWIKWDTICVHRERGGLGVQRVKDFNYALLGKWVWRCLEEGESLWCRLLKAKYGTIGGRLRYGEGVGSPWWQAVNQVRLGVGLLDSNWLLDNIVRKVGDGRSTCFWLDPWLEEESLVRTFRRLYYLAEDKNISVAAMCVAGWGRNGEGWKWRRRLHAWEEELVGQCVGVLSNIVL